jgi:hypothetical protein
MTEDNDTIKRIELLEQQVMNLTSQLLEHQSRLNRIDRRKGTDSQTGRPIEPVNTCTLCLASDGKPTFHMYENGQARECVCKAPFVRATEKYKEQIAKLVRKKVRDDGDAHRANKVLTTR